MATIYQNNDVEITIDSVDEHEANVNINGETLIWISRAEQDDFKKALRELLDKYRI